MRVAIEACRKCGITHFQLKILDGYRAGEFVRNSVSDHLLFDVNSARLKKWAQNTGYQVVSVTE